MSPRGTENFRVAAPDPKVQSWLDSHRFLLFRVGEGRTERMDQKPEHKVRGPKVPRAKVP